MYSDLAARIDSNAFIFEAVGLKDAFDELDEQYGKTSYGRLKYDPEELYWIGYLYRYWAYISAKSSKQLFRLIKPDDLRKLYFPYHSLDPKQAIGRIMEAKGIEESDDIARGVKIMRRIRSSQ